jgi:hypothetical protein
VTQDIQAANRGRHPPPTQSQNIGAQAKRHLRVASGAVLTVLALVVVAGLMPPSVADNDWLATFLGLLMLGAIFVAVVEFPYALVLRGRARRVPPSQPRPGWDPTGPSPPGSWDSRARHDVSDRYTYP